MDDLKPVAALLKLAKDLSQLRSSVLEGSVADIIVDPELAAAKEAFRKVRLARDPRQQVWSAINHLESAHELLKATYFHRNLPFLDGEKTYLFRLSQKDRYVLCLMACCYKALDEEELSETSLAEADSIDWRRYFGGYTRGNIFSFFEPRFWTETARQILSPPEPVLVDHFRQALGKVRPSSVVQHDEGLGG